MSSPGPPPLPPCPARPNCVSSQAEDPRQRVAPLSYEGSREEARARLHRLLSSWPRVHIVAETDVLLQAECRSRLFGFVDDLHAYFPPEPLVHLRSASRLGFFDLGVNRRRIESIRRAFAQAPRE